MNGSAWATVLHCLRNDEFSRFENERISTCDGRTDGHRAVADNAPAYMASRGSFVDAARS